MNKTDLIEQVASATGESKAVATSAVEAVFDTITGSLKSGDSVTILGFGSFVVRHRAARMGRNPKTGEPAHIAASNNAGFKPGKMLKEALNR